MRKTLLFLLIITSLINATELKNLLKSETSPYLQQHVTNPISWIPWSDTAFSKAKRENKAIFYL